MTLRVLASGDRTGDSRTFLATQVGYLAFSSKRSSEMTRNGLRKGQIAQIFVLAVSSRHSHILEETPDDTASAQAVQTLVSSIAHDVTREHDLSNRQPAHLQDEAFLHGECDLGTQSPAMCVRQCGIFSASLAF